MSKTSPANAAFFRALAGLSEEAVLGTLSGIAHHRDRAALNGFLDFLEQDGFPKPKHGTPFSKNSIVDAKYDGDLGKISFSRLIMLVLADPDKKPFTAEARKDALDVVERGLRIHDTHQKNNSADTRKAFLDGVLFDSIGAVHDAEFARGLIAIGANSNGRGHSWAEGKHDDCDSMTEVFRHQNMAAALAFIPHMWDAYASSFINAVVSPYTKIKDKPTSTQNLAEAFQKQPEAVLRVFEAMEEKYGAVKTAMARCRVLSMHLHNCRDVSAPWDEKSVIALIEGSGASRQAMKSAASEEAKGMATEPIKSDEKVQIWRELMEHALKVHCAPAVSLMEDRLKASSDFNFKRPESPMHFLCTTASPSQMFESQRFKATMQCLIETGNDMSKCETGHPPAIHMIAKAKDEPQVRAQKLAVLITLGADPLQRNQFDMLATPSNKDGGKSAWDAVVRSNGARKAAMSILDDIDAPSP